MHRTPKHILADHLLGEPLLDWMHARRHVDRPTSWMQLSHELREATGGQVSVTPETLRSWYVEAFGEKPATAAGTGAA